MHNRGPREMYREAIYRDVIEEIAGGAGESMIATAIAAGVRARGDNHRPGSRLRQTPRAHLRDPGTSRCVGRTRPSDLVRTFAQVLSQSRRFGDVPPGERDWTAAAVAASVLKGAHIVRVHDVRAHGSTSCGLRTRSEGSKVPGSRFPLSGSRTTQHRKLEHSRTQVKPLTIFTTGVRKPKPRHAQTIAGH